MGWRMWCSSFLRRTLDKTEQVSDWGADELSPSQIEYAARTRRSCLRSAQKLDERIAVDGLEEVLELENECVMPIAEMELNGFYLDEERWREQLDKVTKAAGRICRRAAGHAFGRRRPGVAVWPGRDQSRFAAAGDRRTCRISACRCLTRRVRGSCSRWPRNIRSVAKLLEYRGVAKAASSFGENILEFIEPATGRIHADFRQIGAPTGRFSCSSPNLQQIPHEDGISPLFSRS